MNSSIFPWKTLALASAGLIMLFIGGFLISGNQPVQSKQTTHTYKASVNSTGGVDPVAANARTAVKIDPPVVVAKPKPQHKKAARKIAKADTASKSAVSVDEEVPMDEMVVMGITAQGSKTKIDPAAHPVIGWSNFGNYLRESAVSPDGKTGTVKLTFTINNDGTCADIKVKTGLSKAADKKAIDLIKNGSLWAPEASGETKEAAVSVDFH